MGYIKRSMRQVFTALPLKDNYFWQLYFHGQYTMDCCPDYLVEQQQQILSDRLDRIQPHTTSISHFLLRHPGAYSHYILLDHQDWLAANNRPALEEEWSLILQNSRPGSRILLRSAADQVDFLPDFVLDEVQFDREAAQAFHSQDRVGTYGSVYIGTVR